MDKRNLSLTWIKKYIETVRKLSHNPYVRYVEYTEKITCRATLFGSPYV